ncbi:MAG: fatty acid desaturase [Nitrospirae bacterium]|nr:fatty acid desaturase [Nitrospirota bacterium]
MKPAQVGNLLWYAASDWIVIVSVTTAMYFGPWWLYPFGVLLVAGRLHALGVVLHDACHMKDQRKTPALRLLECVAAYPIATTLKAMRYHHLRHHRDSGMPTDPYFKAGVSSDRAKRFLMTMRGAFLVPAWILRSIVGCVALLRPKLRTSYGRLFLQDRSGADLTSSREVLACLKEEPFQLCFFLVVGCIGLYYPTELALFYGLPLVVAGMLNVNRVIVEHDHVRCWDRLPGTVIATTRTHDWRAWGKLFLFPRNIGFHLVHHLYPRAPLASLPELHAWDVERLTAPSGHSYHNRLPVEEDGMAEPAEQQTGCDISEVRGISDIGFDSSQLIPTSKASDRAPAIR